MAFDIVGSWQVLQSIVLANRIGDKAVGHSGDKGSEPQSIRRRRDHLFAEYHCNMFDSSLAKYATDSVKAELGVERLRMTLGVQENS